MTLPSVPPAEARAVNRRTGVMFAVYLLVIAFGLVAYSVAGLERGRDDPEPGETVERFSAAYERRDGEAACEELSDDAQSQLATVKGKPCPEAIFELEDVSGGDVSGVDVAEVSASVAVEEGGRFFLDDTSRGWRIAALGCEPRPGQPYDCELES